LLCPMMHKLSTLCFTTSHKIVPNTTSWLLSIYRLTSHTRDLLHEGLAACFHTIEHNAMDKICTFISSVAVYNSNDSGV
uniref:Mediator complex subunit 24 n=1 Tax=Hymenolepis diminuta TaxID=6216 RepID=A0A0R3SZF7_HYMDI